MKYAVQILLFKTYEEEVRTFSRYYMVQTMGGSHSKVFFNPLMHGGNKHLKAAGLLKYV